MTLEDIRLYIASVVKLTGIKPRITTDHYNTLLERANLEMLERAIQELGHSQKVTDKLKPLKTKVDLTFAAGSVAIPADYVRYLAIYDQATNVAVEVLDDSEIGDRLGNAITPPSTSYPVVYFVDDAIKVLPSAITTGFDMHYIKKPTTPVYATSVTNAVNVYASGSSTQFDWDDAYHAEIIILILGYLGIQAPESFKK